MPFVSGFLRARHTPGRPDQGLPGHEGPVDPDYGIDAGGGVWPGVPDNSLPMPPPGVWPPLTPSHPIQPAPPGTPPGVIWPPIYGGGRPTHPIAPGGGGGHPDQGLPGDQPHPDQGLPGSPPRPDHGLPSKTYWVVVGIPGVGWRYVAVDPTLTVGYPLPGGQPHPDQGLPAGGASGNRPNQDLPPTPQPKR